MDDKKYSSNNLLEADFSLKYAFLSRMKVDLEYYFGASDRHPKHLYFETIGKHIEETARLLSSIPIESRPDWLSLKDVANYASKAREATGEIKKVSFLTTDTYESVERELDSPCERNDITLKQSTRLLDVEGVSLEVSERELTTKKIQIVENENFEYVPNYDEAATSKKKSVSLSFAGGEDLIGPNESVVYEQLFQELDAVSNVSYINFPKELSNKIDEHKQCLAERLDNEAYIKVAEALENEPVTGAITASLSGALDGISDKEVDFDSWGDVIERIKDLSEDKLYQGRPAKEFPENCKRKPSKELDAVEFKF